MPTSCHTPVIIPIHYPPLPVATPAQPPQTWHPGRACSEAPPPAACRDGDAACAHTIVACARQAGCTVMATCGMRALLALLLLAITAMTAADAVDSLPAWTRPRSGASTASTDASCASAVGNRVEMG